MYQQKVNAFLIHFLTKKRSELSDTRFVIKCRGIILTSFRSGKRIFPGNIRRDLIGR